MNILNNTISSTEFSDSQEIFFSYVSCLPFDYLLENHSFILRRGERKLIRAKKPGEVDKYQDIYTNIYYHAPNGRQDIKDAYKAKDLAERTEIHNKLVEYSKKSGKPQFRFPLQEDNGVYGKEHLLRVFRIEAHKGNTLYFAPNSIDSSTIADEVDKWGDGTTRIIRIENDDTESFTEKLQYLERLGLPKPSLVRDSGNKSPHNDYILHEPISFEEAAELAAQMLRNSGFDGYEKTIQHIIKDLKTLILRIPGFKHQKTGRECSILEINDIYNYEDLKAQIGKFPKLGEYKAQSGKEFVFDTYPTGVQAFETILSSEWKQRFHPYESYADYKARLAAKAEEDKARIEANKAEREKQLQGLSPKEIKRRAESIKGEIVSLLQFVDYAVKQHVENGTPDGTGRSHKVAKYVAKSLLEAQYLVSGSPLRAKESAEELFRQWVDKTFNSSENDLIKKVWTTFTSFEKGTNVPHARHVDKFESYLTSRQETKIGEDAIAHLKHNRTITNLIEEAVRGLKQKPQQLTFADLPLLYSASENGWNNAITFLNENKSIYITTCPTHALAILNTGIPGVCYVNKETSAVNLHLLAEYACENGFTFNFTPNAPGTDRMLAENLRAGYYSQVARNLLRKNNKDTKIKDYKPTVVVIDEKGIEWSAHYYWVRVTQVITPKMLGNRKNKEALLYGHTANRKWFSDVVKECESTAKNRKLVAFVSEMGTGKTEVLANQVKAWSEGKLLAIAHREQLTRQAAKRLNIVDYKAPHYRSASEKYEAAKKQGLAITINTLCQGTNEQGYLPDFKIDDWKDATLVIDETESFVKYLIESGTIAENRQKAITALKTLVVAIYKAGGRIILADANLRVSTINLFQHWCGGEEYDAEATKAKYNCYVILNSYCKFKEEGRKAIFTDARDGLNSEVNRRLAAKDSTHKALFFTDIKQSSSKFYWATQGFGNYLRDLKLGRILDADTRQFSDDPDHHIVDNLHAVVSACCKGVIFISPVIDSGTDWNNLGLDCVYGVYMGIMGMDNTLQQLERVRDNVVRFIWAARRSSMGMTKGDITNIEKNFEEVRRSYDGSKAALMQTWADMKVLQHSEIEARIAAQFPDLDKNILAWWQDSLEESFYAAQEFRINLKARMQEKGYTIEHQDFESDAEFIATLQEYGEAQKEKKLVEIANADLALLDSIEKNQDTMPKDTARAKDLKGILYSLGVKVEGGYGWCNGYNEDEKLELVRRTLGKRSKTRRKLVYGFSFRCAMTNGQEDIAKIIYMAEEFRNMINSSSRSIKDTPMSMKAGIDFMINTMDIKGLASVLLQEASKRGKLDNGRPVMFFHNRMPIIIKTNKVLVENRAYVKKTFGFDVDVRPDMAATNISKFFTCIGWNVEKGRNREAGAGKAANGNAPLNNYTITEDQLTLRVWTGWVAQYENRDEGMFSYFYNPSGDEGGDALWKAHLGIATETTDKQVSKPVFQQLQQHRQLAFLTV
jgi:hypothetical protein